MVTFNFDLKLQVSIYKSVKDKLKTQFYQELHFYVLPYMPVKFRNRVVFLPEKCEPEKIYTKQKIKINNLKTAWEKETDKFLFKLNEYFPKFENINISISPSLYGSLGSYVIKKNIITLKPRYDRTVSEVQNLCINALTNLYYPKLNWNDKQRKASVIQGYFFPKNKSMLKILDTEFAGKLAEESAKYLEKLKVSSKKAVTKPDNLSKSENIVFNLLLRSKNKLVTFDEIADWLWNDKADKKYSEYAITKLMERLKRKLPKNIIHSQRGTGYILCV